MNRWKEKKGVLDVMEWKLFLCVPFHPILGNPNNGAKYYHPISFHTILFLSINPYTHSLRAFSQPKAYIFLYTNVQDKVQ